MNILGMRCPCRRHFHTNDSSSNFDINTLTMSKLKLLGEVVLGGILVDGLIYFALWLWNFKRDKEIGTTLANLEKGGKFEASSCTDDTVFHQVLFFPESKMPCRFYYQSGCKRRDCQFSHETALISHLICHLNKAKKTVDFCVYLLTCYELCQAILQVQRRGIRVRVITDGNFADDATSKIGLLRAEGIAIHCNPPEFYMHHKFVIVDDSILFNGSFNWTWQAITGNHENLCITNNKAMVEPYVNEFKRLWSKFDPKMLITATHTKENGI